MKSYVIHVLTDISSYDIFVNILTILSLIISITSLIVAVYIYRLSVLNSRKKLLMEIKVAIDRVIDIYHFLYTHSQKNKIAEKSNAISDELYMKLIELRYEQDYYIPGIGKSESLGHRTIMLNSYYKDLDKALKLWGLDYLVLYLEYTHGKTYFMQHYNLSWKFISSWKTLWIPTSIKPIYSSKSEIIKYGSFELRVPDEIVSLEDLYSYQDYVNAVTPQLSAIPFTKRNQDISFKIEGKINFST